MMCKFCTPQQKLPVNDDIVDHLIILKYSNGHIHVHGPLDNKELIKQFILILGKEAGIEIEND